MGGAVDVCADDVPSPRLHRRRDLRYQRPVGYQRRLQHSMPRWERRERPDVRNLQRNRVEQHTYVCADRLPDRHALWVGERPVACRRAFVLPWWISVYLQRWREAVSGAVYERCAFHCHAGRHLLSCARLFTILTLRYRYFDPVTRPLYGS